MSNNKKHLLAYLGLVLMTLIVGLSFIFVKIGLRTSDSYDLLAHRFTAAFVTVIVLKVFGLIKSEKKNLKDWVSIFMVSLFYPILCFGLQTLGMEHSTASNAGIIFALVPVFTLIGGSVFLKERSTFLQKLGIGVSVLGLVYISWRTVGEHQSQSLKGSVLLLLSVIAFVGYYLTGKKLMQRFSSISLTSIMIINGFVVFNVISVLRHTKSGTLPLFFEPFADLNFTLSVLYLGVLSSVLTSFLSNFALRYIPTYNVSVFNNISPIIAIVGGVVLLGETLLLPQIIGAVVVLLGVGLVLGFEKST